MDRQTLEEIKDLHNKIDSKDERMADKVDKLNESISKLLGPLSTVTAKVESHQRLIWWLFGIIAAVITSAAVAVMKGALK